MQFTLASEQFHFEEGDAFLIRIEAADTVPAFTADGRLRSNVVDYPNIVAPGEFLLPVWNCLVQSRLSRLSRRIAAVTFRALVSPEDIRQNRVEIPIGFHSFVRIEVLGSDGKLTDSQPSIGVAVKDMTVEGRVNQQGGLDVLAPVGHGMVYLFEQPSISVPFEILPGTEDAGTVTLQMVT